MRIAVVSDIHANLTALEAVASDLRRVGVDLVVHGGDLVSGGEIDAIYGLQSSVVVYGHIHQRFVRRLAPFTLVNSGAVSLSYHGDPRAAYALIDGQHIQIKRVEYDIEEEIRLLLATDDPFAESTVETLRSGRPASPR